MPDSWVATRKTDGRAVLETWDARVANRVNRNVYHVETARNYLERINRDIRTAAASLPVHQEP